MKVLAVRDRAIDAFGTPIFVVAIGMGMRSFIDEVNRSESVMYQHPEDYDLYHIGDYDEFSGKLVPMEPKMLAVGKDCVKPKE